MPRYDPSKSASIAARAAAKLRAAEAMPSPGIPHQGGPQEGGPLEGSPSQGIPAQGIPTTPSIMVEVPERGYVKAANWLWDMLPKTLDNIYDWAVYTYLYRLTVGYNSTDCTVSISTIQKNLCIGRNTVIRSLGSLRNKGLITTGDVTNDGTAITLFAPVMLNTIPSQGSPQEGSPSQGIPHQGSPPQGNPPEGSPGMPSQGSPSRGIASNAQHMQGVPSQGSPSQGHRTNICIDNNNKQDAAVESVYHFLRAQGMTVPRSRVKGWVAKGVTLQYVREIAADIKTWADNPTGALIDAIEKGDEASAAAIEAAAVAEALKAQAVCDAQIRQEEQEWLEREKLRLGPDGMAEIRSQALRECEENWVYQRAKTEEGRKGIVEAKITEILLRNRE